MANLSAERFAALLRSLDADPDVGAEKYLLLRHKLVRVFERLSCGDPDELADEVMDRVAMKLQKESIHNLNSFAYAVAMKVSLERRKTSARLVSMDGPEQHKDSLTGERDLESRILDRMGNARHMECLRQCLQRLNAEDRQLLFEYYKGEKQARIRHRQELAEQRATTLPRLRSEVNMLRERLRHCIERCLKSKNLRLIQRP